MNALGIIIAILIFGFIIAIHEFGHFIVAKKNGVRVNEFSIGMGPKLISRKKGETVYSWRLFPIGGFCSMEGEDEESKDEKAFGNKTVWKRIKIVIAGACMNLILGLILVIILNCINPYVISMKVSRFEEDSMSHKTGLEIGDKITNINGLHIFSDMDLSYALSTDSDGVYDMTVKRNGKKVELKNVTLNKDILDGKETTVMDFKVTALDKTPFNVVTNGFVRSFSMARLVWVSLGDLVTGHFKMNELSGPVGIVKLIGDKATKSTGETVKNVIQNLLNISAFLTINVGIMNLLPVPALDGGRLIFLIIEAIRGKPVKPEHEGRVHFIGIVILFAIMILVTYNDILNLIRG